MVECKKQQFVANRAAPLSIPQGALSPKNARVLATPVSAPDFAELREGWLCHDLNQALGPTDPTSVKFTCVSTFEPGAYLSERGVLIEHAVTEDASRSLVGEVTVVITRARTLDGFALLWERDVGHGPTTALPSESVHEEVFLPISEPFDVRPGDRLTLNFHQPEPATDSRYIARWSGGVDWDAKRTFHLRVLG